MSGQGSALLGVSASGVRFPNGGGRTRRDDPVGPDGRPGLNPSSYLTKAQWRSLAVSLQLSDRQLQIVRHTFDGQDEAAIAGALGISSHTVHTYMDRLHRKLGVHCRCELIVRLFLTYLAAEGTEGPPTT